MNDLDEVLLTMNKKGLGYFILHYCEAKDMPDKESKELFQKAFDALQDFEIYVKTNAKYAFDD